MYLDKITLHNIRGFDDLEFSLDRGQGNYAGWTVFTGDNGSGKSTLLKALAVALTGANEARALQPSFRGWIREGQHDASIEVVVKPVPNDDKFRQQGKSTKDPFPAKLVIRNGSREPTLESEHPHDKQSNYKTPLRTIWASDAAGWFSCGYGPFRRVFGASPEAVRQMMAPNTERFVTMFNEAASLSEVDQWLKTLAHKKLEFKLFETTQLDLLQRVLSDDLMPNQITVDRVDSDGLWLRDRNGLKLSWGEMSDGYRSVLALLADILRHLIKAYGPDDLIKSDKDGRLFIGRSGVVLIDEIDAHLHPEWQRDIGFWLKRHFPNIQFLVTTHSPLICQAADPKGLFVLPEPGSTWRPRPLSDEEYQKVIASKPDTILLSGAFGLTNTRSDRAVEQRQVHARLSAKKRSGANLTTEELEALGQSNLFVTDEEP